MTHSPYLQDLIRVNTDNKVPTWPRRHRDLQQGPRSLWWCLQHHPFLKSSCFIFIFHHLPVSADNSVIPLLCHSAAPSYFNLSSHNLAFSHSLYKYLSLSLSLFPPLLLASEENGGNLPSPVDVNTHLRLGVLQLAGANRTALRLSYRTNWRHLYSPQHW